MRRAIISRTGCSPSGDDFPRIVHIVSGVGGENCFHLLAPEAYIFSVLTLILAVPQAIARRISSSAIPVPPCSTSGTFTCSAMAFISVNPSRALPLYRPWVEPSAAARQSTLGFCHQGVALPGIGVDDFGIDNAVFTAGDGPQFGLHRDTFAVGQRHQWRVMAGFSLNGRCEPSNIMELKPAAIAASQASREVP